MTSVKSINAPTAQTMARAHFSRRVAAMRRHPTTLAPRYPDEATKPRAMRPAGTRLRVTPLVSGSIMMELTLPPNNTVMSA